MPFQDESTRRLHAASEDVRVVGSRARGGVKGVLIVDDSEDMRLLLRVALDAAPGFEVWAEAGNGAEALDRVDERCPDIVLLDIVMPVMDGVTALPMLRERCPNAAVVVVSTTANAEVRERMLLQGASEVCDKTSADGLIAMLSAL
ncbi:MAG: response regulator transcription factor [Microthrixaceae bacterium]